MSLQRGINLRALAEKMGQCSGAEVRGICTEAGKFISCVRYMTGLMATGRRHVRFAGAPATRYTGGL